MATRANLPEQVRGARLFDGLKIQNIDCAVTNRAALDDTTNLVPINPCTTTSVSQFVNAQLEKKTLNGNTKVPKRQLRAAPKYPEAQKAAPKRLLVVTKQPKTLEAIVTKKEVTKRDQAETQRAAPKRHLVVKTQKEVTKKDVAEAQRAALKRLFVVKTQKEVTKKDVAEAQKAAQKRHLVVKTQKEVTKKEVAVSPKGKKVTFSSVLSARSKAACGITNKPKILDIDEYDKDNHLAAVEYVDDMYSFFKEVEKESQPPMYMHIQTEINEKMRAILIDWVLSVHMQSEFNLETFYLTVNIIDRFLSVKAVPRRKLQLVGAAALLIASKYEEIWPIEVHELVCFTDNAYISKEILVMEKDILGNLEWYLTVPTQYVFLVRFIKASICDPEMENMVYFLAELGMLHYDALMFCPSMLAASAVYTARCSLSKSPTWTDTLKFHTGYSESEIMECSKLLASLHSGCKESRLRVVYEKYSKAENGGVALVLPAKSLWSAAANLKKPFFI